MTSDPFVEPDPRFGAGVFAPLQAQVVDVAALFDVSVDLLVIRDLDGVVLKASRSWETTLGHAPHEMEGTYLLGLVHPEDMPGTLGAASEVLNRKPGDAVLGYTNRYRHKDGSYRLLEWRAQRLGDRIYGVARDVTERTAADKLGMRLHDITGIIDALSRTRLTPEQAEMVGFIREAVTGAK